MNIFEILVSSLRLNKVNGGRSTTKLQLYCHNDAKVFN